MRSFACDLLSWWGRRSMPPPLLQIDCSAIDASKLTVTYGDDSSFYDPSPHVPECVTLQPNLGAVARVYVKPLKAGTNKPLKVQFNSVNIYWPTYQWTVLPCLQGARRSFLAPSLPVPRPPPLPFGAFTLLPPLAPGMRILLAPCFCLPCFCDFLMGAACLMPLHCLSMCLPYWYFQSACLAPYVRPPSRCYLSCPL